jgi:hypothetical protein
MGDVNNDPVVPGLVWEQVALLVKERDLYDSAPRLVFCGAGQQGAPQLGLEEGRAHAGAAGD